jgi:hypothetical protein
VIRQANEELALENANNKGYSSTKVVIMKHKKVQKTQYYAAIACLLNPFVRAGGILRSFGFRNFAEILLSVAILRSRFCRDLQKFAVKLRLQKKKKNCGPNIKNF